MVGGSREEQAAEALRALTATHQILHHVGYESHIFDLGRSVLKLPRPIFLRHMTAAQELQQRAEQMARLVHYAPRARARMVGLSAAGRRTSFSKAACIALLLRKGEPLAFLPSQTHIVSAELARHLAHAHRQAADPTAALDRGHVADFLSFLLEVASRAQSSVLSCSLVAKVSEYAGSLVANAVELPLNVRPGHGEPTLANVIAIAGEPQWIDTGSGPLRLIDRVVDFGDDGPWDLGAFVQSVRTAGGMDAVRIAVEAYAASANHDRQKCLRVAMTWAIIWILSTIAATVLHWHDLAEGRHDAHDWPAALVPPLQEAIEDFLKELQRNC